MAVTSEIKKISVSMKLDNGTTETGTIKVVGVSLGSLDKSNYDNQKAINCVDAITSLLSKSLVRTEKTEVDLLESE